MNTQTKILFLCLLGLVAIEGTLWAQPFREVYQSIDPQPEGFNYFSVYPFTSRVQISGNWGVASSHNSLNENSFNLIPGAGSAYVFYRDQKGEWDFYQKLVATDRGFADVFSVGLALAPPHLAIGSPFEDHDVIGQDSLEEAGSVYAFNLVQQPALLWEETQKFVASDRAAGDRFGYVVAMDGDQMLVSAPRKPDTLNQIPFSEVGQVYVFQFDSVLGWQESQRLRPPHAIGFEQFGFSLAIHDSLAAVGVPYEDHEENGSNLLTDAGGVFLYRLQPTGTWTWEATLTPQDREAFDWFGHSVSIWDSTVMVGAPWEEDAPPLTPLLGAGAVYVFQQTPQGSWTEIQKISAVNRGLRQHFGWDVVVDRDNLFVGHSITGGSGKVARWHLQGNQWTFVRDIRASDHEGGDQFGFALDVDSSTLIVGAPRKETPVGGVEEDGKLYIFEQCPVKEFVRWDTTCPGTPYLFEGAFLTEPGLYAENFSLPNGCDSSQLLYLAVAPVETGLTAMGDTLIALAGGQATYQWLDCEGDSLLPGATGRQFVPTRSGNYAAIIDQYGCTDTSACMTLTVSSLAEILASQLSVFPNPAYSQVQLSFPRPQSGLLIRWYDLQGRLLTQESLATGHQFSVEVPGNQAGIYLLQLEFADGSRLVRKIEKLP